MIKLTTPQNMHDDETKTEYDPAKISGISSVTGNEDERGTHFWIAGSFQRHYCRESARQVRQMIDDALNSEEVQLGAEAVGLLVRGVQSADGGLHFIEGDGFLGVVVADFKSEPLRGRARSNYEHARDELVRHGFIVLKGGGLHYVTQRGYEAGDHLAGGPLDKPFRGLLRLPARPVESATPMIFNQTNNNKGDVNNAVSEKGSVVQNVTKIMGGITEKDRIFIDDIESFSKVRDVAPAAVASLLKDGYLDVAEDMVQKALEEILNVPFHKLDCPNEYNDLYTLNILVDGARRQVAFMLKGNGLKKKVMEIRDCGKNGDQVVRLFQSPADLFVIQFVGNIAEAVIQHAHGEMARLRTQGKEAHFVTLDGQDTARLLTAYSKLTPPPTTTLPAALPAPPSS
jgi:hypothetical protein